MSGLQIALLVALVLLTGLYLSLTAGRLDQLNHRVDVAREALNTQLARRVSAAWALVTSNYLDPVSTMVVADAADACATAETGDVVNRGLAESELSRALRAAFTDPEVADYIRDAPGGQSLLEDLDSACTRVMLARRFHNDAVGATKHMRSRRAVRYFRLAGSAVEPVTMEMDDSPPTGLV